MISDLMLFARPPRLERQAVDVPKLLRAGASGAGGRVPPPRRRAAASPPTPICRRSTADAVQLAVAVKALCRERPRSDRPRRADRRGGKRWPSDGKSLRIAVRDDGPGIPADVRPHIFDPFYSGREAGRGLGFGLSKCWRIVTEHGGRVSAAERRRARAPRSRSNCRSARPAAAG